MLKRVVGDLSDPEFIPGRRPASELKFAPPLSRK